MSLTVMSAALSAQTASPVAFSYSSTQDTKLESDPRISHRLVTGAIGGLAGAAILGTIGYQLGKDCHSSCLDPDSPGFIETAFGILVGGTIGSAIGAALPQGRGLCGGGQRFARTLAGASVGLATGIGLAMVPPLGFGFVATIPIGSVLFMRKC
jgi:hypothetical protein